MATKAKMAAKMDKMAVAKLRPRGDVARAAAIPRIPDTITCGQENYIRNKTEVHVSFKFSNIEWQSYWMK